MKQNSDDAAMLATRQYRCDLPTLKGMATRTCHVRGFAGMWRDHELISLAPDNHRNVPKDVPEQLIKQAGQARWFRHRGNPRRPGWRKPSLSTVLRLQLPATLGGGALLSGRRIGRTSIPDRMADGLNAIAPYRMSEGIVQGMIVRIVAAAIIVFAGVAGAADFDAGVKAYHRGNYAAALTEFRALAEQGIPEAQFNLGRMYHRGEGLVQNFRHAHFWFLQAANPAMERGIPEAQFALGIMNYHGQGITQDLAAAAAWFGRAAGHGLAAAQWNLGIMHYEGKGVVQDFVFAYAWFSLAGSQGHDISNENRDRLRNLMTREQVAEAKRLGSEFDALIREKACSRGRAACTDSFARKGDTGLTGVPANPTDWAMNQACSAALDKGGSHSGYLVPPDSCDSAH